MPRELKVGVQILKSHYIPRGPLLTDPKTYDLIHITANSKPVDGDIAVILVLSCFIGVANKNFIIKDYIHQLG